ncbi:related to 3-oxoacyl-[acyl-carrier-protein] reductase [Fusarium torulosum]|uniref:Related to 3-oxoacyl-[acyl-carrier-protein] reductase n=1 Tax=Fusarium torulosum TaxID=33205 RepID=A0AAE8M1P5_9HYPO|nr:related to 3-oxoacyl-[acyl-carrier-protein] reductase [Fusarium torulosum]
MPDFKGLDLTGKTAIVTGASRGIGAAIAIQLGQRGANVVVNYTSDKSKQRAIDVVSKIEEAGSRGTICQASVANVKEIPKIVDAALQLSQTGKIEILVHKYNPLNVCDVYVQVLTEPTNSAALGVDANLDEVTEELFQTHFDTNVKGPIFLTKAVVPHIAKGGRVVFVSSAAARLGVAGQTVYGATKAANESCARVWAKELGQSHGITVNCVNPGPVATDQWQESDDQFRQDMQPLIESTPAAARIAETDDIAPLVAFLCTEDARWATGSVLCANGGLYN